MNQKISFTKSNKGLLLFGILLMISLSFVSFTTESFTAFPDFQGSGKLIVADFLLIPSTLGIIMMLYVFLKFPKLIEMDQSTSTVTLDGRKLDNPVEATIQSNNREKVYYRLTLKSQGKEILKTGFIYKIENTRNDDNSLASDNKQIVFIDE